MRRECRERFSHHRLQRKLLVSDPGMHQCTCVTHVPWFMSGSLIRGGGENVPGIPGARATLKFTYLVRGPCKIAIEIWAWISYYVLHFNVNANTNVFPTKLIASQNNHVKSSPPGSHPTNDILKVGSWTKNSWISGWLLLISLTDNKGNTILPSSRNCVFTPLASQKDGPFSFFMSHLETETVFSMKILYSHQRNSDRKDMMILCLSQESLYY